MIAEQVQTKQRQDWFLISIIGGIVVLVVTALVLVLSNPNSKEFLPDDLPENIAQNYFLALEQGDYKRAYRYLSPSLASYPEDIDRFSEDIYDIWNCQPDELERSTFIAQSSNISGNRATIEMQQSRFYESRSIFNNGGSYVNDFRVLLAKEADGWRIIDSDVCWSYEWNQSPKTEDNNNEIS